MPRLGGIGLFTAIFFLELFLLGLYHFGLLRSSKTPLLAIQGCLGAAALLFLVGLVDDFKNLRARTKLVFQIFAGTWVYFSGISAFHPSVSLFGHEVGPVISYAATVFWILAITNAINIIDGVDGLAAGSALLSTLTIVVMALVARDLLLAVQCIILCGALIGFLRFNFNPATVFLGDCGSLLVGSMLAVLGLMVHRVSQPGVMSLLAPVVALGLPITETVVSVVRRIVRGTGIFVPDRGHIHHKLLDLGCSQRQTVAFLYGFSSICALASICMLYPDPFASVLVLLLVIGMAALGIQKLGYAEFGEIKRIANRTIEHKQVMANSVEFRYASYRLSKATSLDQVYLLLREVIEGVGLCGFQLTLARNIESAQLNPKIAGTMKWEQQGNSALHPRWSLTLQLRSDAWGQFGTLTLEGLVGERQMLFDPNVLLLDLQPALSAKLGELLSYSRPGIAPATTKRTPVRTVQDLISDTSSNFGPN